MINELSFGILRYHFEHFPDGLICELTNFCNHISTYTRLSKAALNEIIKEKLFVNSFYTHVLLFRYILAIHKIITLPKP